MIRQRVSTVLTTVSLLLSLTTAAALPAVTLAALPAVLVGYGTNSDALPAPTSGANPAAVRPSQPVQIQIWAKNGDSSTISQFYLKVISSGTLQSATWNMSSGPHGTCVPTSTVTCSFGQLRPGVTVYVTALFTAPATTTVEATMTNQFVFSTTGTAPDGGNNSHGDTFPISQNVRVSSSDDFDGRYLLNNAGTVVQNLQTLSSDNQQATTVFSPATGIGVSVEDGPGLSGGCGAGATCFSETSEIHVGDGSTQYGPFKVVVNLHSSNIPSGVNANSITVYHDGEPITDLCGKNPVAECYSVKKFSWGLQVTIWLLHNGKLNIG
jgi:hypothetical protein